MTNKDRAKRAADALASYNDDSEDSNIVDLLANIMHLCKQKDYDFDNFLSTARMHFDAEKIEDDAFLIIGECDAECVAPCGCRLTLLDGNSGVAFFMCDAHKSAMSNTFHTIHSSHGDLLIDNQGFVVSVNKFCDCKKGEKCGFDFEAGKGHFNVEEYIEKYGALPSDIDILDIGFIDKYGLYEPPHAGWRLERERLRTEENDHARI